MDHDSSGNVGCWFVVLPDCEPASAVLAWFERFPHRVLAHASGRPWIVGCWDDSRAQTVETGHARAAILGVCDLSHGHLAKRVHGLKHASEAERVVTGAAGNYHLIVSCGGHVYARGSVLGARRLFHCEHDGVELVADRARTLAWIRDEQPDPNLIASQLASQVAPPYPFDLSSVWPRVTAVRPGEAIGLDQSGRSRTMTWWSPPDGIMSLGEAAELLRQALRDAVSARLCLGRAWGADLSGGMDSSSLCFLAAEAGAQLVVSTLDWRGPGNEDLDYAKTAMSQLSAGTQHIVFRHDDVPPLLGGIDENHAGDDPSLMIRDLAQQRHISAALRSRGAITRLGGQGGDQVVLPPPSHLHDLFRRQPGLALRHLVGVRAQSRWPRSATLRSLVDQRPFDSWLGEQARSLIYPERRSHPQPELSWGPAVRMPQWSTRAAREQVAELLLTAGRTSEPLAPDRGRHAWLSRARQAGRIAGGYLQRNNIVEMPFCDDAIIDVCLRVRPHEATAPWSYKPLLAAAMEGVVPREILERTTKDNAGVEWHAGMRSQRHALASLCDDSRLAAMGLVDADQMRRGLLSPETLPVRDLALAEATIATEIWLRSVASKPQPDYLEKGIAS